MVRLRSPQVVQPRSAQVLRHFKKEPSKACMRSRRFLILLASTALIFLGTKAYASETVQRPYDTLNRAEAVTAILRSQERYAPQVVWFTANLPKISLFTDTDQSAWYAPYLEVGFLEGVITGNANGTYRPADPISIEQALVMLRRVQRSTRSIAYHTTPRLQNYPDQWYTDAISEANARNLIPSGSPLRPGSHITRGQFFAILHRLEVIERENLYAYVEEIEDIEVSKEIELRIPAVTSVLPVPLAPFPVPFQITPLPFLQSDPFILRLPPKQRRMSQVPSIYTQYISQKPFAITIPDLGIEDVAIAHPADPFSQDGILQPLKTGLGHLFAYPGDQGKTMVYGHSSGYPWDISEFTRMFRQINKLQSGDRVYVTYDDKLHVYEVDRKEIIDAKDVSPFDDDGTSELILYTCWPPDSIKERYLVYAFPVETVALR